MKVNIYKDIAYSNTENINTYDVYSPSINLTNLLIWVHGGAWVSGDKEDFSKPARDLAEQYNIATVALNYRLSPRPSETLKSMPIQHPVHTQDCLLGVLHILSNQEKFNICAKNIHLGGHSAGGQISGLLAFNPSLYVNNDIALKYPDWKTLISKISGVFVTEGIFDLESFAKFDPSYILDYIKPAFGEELDNWKAASPQNIDFNKAQEFRTAPKIRYHFIHSSLDLLVDALQSSNFDNKLKKLCYEGKYELLDLGTHDEVPLSEAVLQRLASFINF